MKARTILAMAALLAGGILVAALQADSKPAKGGKEGGPITAGAILMSDANKDSLMAFTDGEDAPVKYVFGDKLDKSMLGVMKMGGLFSWSRIVITYTRDGDTRTLLSIRKDTVPAKGMVTGTVIYHTDFGVIVKPPKGPPDGYALNFPPAANADKLKALNPGDVVAIKFHTDIERHRIDSLDVAPQKK